jgi:Ca-activated chloride channel family protein
MHEFDSSQMSDFHFLRPEFLLLLVPWLALLGLRFWRQRRAQQWQQVISPRLRPYMIKQGGLDSLKYMRAWLIGASALGIVGSAGPTWSLLEGPEQKLETPLVIVMDLSQSMLAIDYQPNRLERAKFKISDLLDANPRARTALIGFAGSAHTIVPLTEDYEIIRTQLDGLGPNLMPIPGTNLRAALTLADSLAERTRAPGTVLLFTDEFSDSTAAIVHQFRQSSAQQLVLVPMATESGAYIPQFGSRKAMLGPDGKRLLSKLDPVVIRQIAQIADVTISPMTIDDSDMQILAGQIKQNLNFTTRQAAKTEDWQDNGWWFIMPIVAGFLLLFRRGMVLYSALFFFALSGCGQVKSFSDLWFTRDFQAQRMVNKGHFSEAAATFTDPLHAGVAWYKAGEYEKAADAFARDSTAVGRYNLGLALYESGDYTGALIAFMRAAEQDSSLQLDAKGQQQLEQLVAGQEEIAPGEVPTESRGERAENELNQSPEDLSGGGQEATEEDMQKERLEENVATDVRTGKELEDVPEDFESGSGDAGQKMLIRQVDDDPTLFLTRKFRYQVKKRGLKGSPGGKTW